MFTWIITNKQWLFSGAGIAVIATFVGIIKFLRKRSHHPDEVIVRFEGMPTAPAPGVQQAPQARIERISPITPTDIHDAIANAIPLQRKAIEKSFVGMKVEWDTLLRGADEKTDCVVQLHLQATDKQLFSIFCYVKLKDYQELGILPENSKIRVYGEIEEAAQWLVSLKDVELKYLEIKGK